MMKSGYTEDRHQIILLNELYKMHNETKMKKKTIALYDLYQDAKMDQLPLHNLHTIAKLLINQNLKVQVEKIEDEEEEKVYYRYNVVEDQESQKIQSKMFNIEGQLIGEGHNNIWLYQMEEGDTRIIVLPINSDMIDISALKEEAEQDDEQNIKKNKEMNILSGKELEESKAQLKESQDKRKHDRCIIASGKHLKMFKIESFLGTILQKTEKVSICSLVQICDRRKQTIEEYQKQFNKIFMVPQEFKFQCIFHGFSEKKKKVVEQSTKEAVTTIFSNEKGKFGIKKYNVNQDQYFFSKQNIRTKIYQKIQKTKTDAISTVITDFVNNWSRILIEAAMSFESIVKPLSSFIKQQQPNLEDSNISMEETSRDIPMSYDYYFKNFMIEDLQLPTKDTLGSFIDQNSSMKGIKRAEGEEKVPRAVEPLLFLHLFGKIHNQFSQFLKQEGKSQALKLLPEWKKVIKKVFELLKDIQGTTLLEEKYEGIRCSNLQLFFNFITFAFDSLIKIHKITDRALSTHTELLNKFDKLKIEKTQILNYILHNQDKIYPSQPIHFYDIYIMIVTQNSTNELLKELQFVFLHIHQKKAICIAKSHIHDLQKITQAIKSLALIGEKYHGLAQNKRKQIDIQKIQNITARLLKIVGQEELAALIYIKMRQYDLAHKAFQMAFVRLIAKNDEKAQKLMTWGNYFKDGFQYDLAQHYYRRAFTCAQRKKIRQQAISLKFKCIEHAKKEISEEEMRVHNKFMEDGDVLAYTNEKQQLDKMIKMFRRVRVCLSWDREAECSTLLDKEWEGDDANSSFYRIVEADKKSQIMSE